MLHTRQLIFTCWGAINDNLKQQAKTLYDYWFVQFDFPNAEGKPYKSSGGKMVWNEVLKKNIPQGWCNEKIGDLGTIIGGSTPSKAIEENFSQEGIPWITPKDLSLNVGKKFITKGEIDLSEKGRKEAALNLLPPRSVLMSSRAPVGYLAVNRVTCTTNQGFKSIVCNKSYSCEYIYYVLNQYMPTIEANATGSTFKEISGTVFKAINIIKPSRTIVNEFTKKGKKIFDKQDNLEKQNQQLSALRDWLLPMLMNGQVKIS
ncbi:MAG: restriction endonuclease subunit S [Niabella sp.]